MQTLCLYLCIVILSLMKDGFESLSGSESLSEISPTEMVGVFELSEEYLSSASWRSSDLTLPRTQLTESEV